MSAFFNFCGVLTDTANNSEVVSFIKAQLSAFGAVCWSIMLRLAAAAIVFFIGAFLIKFLIKRFPEGKKYEHMDPTVRRFTKNFISMALFILLIISVIAIMGVPMSSVVAVIASAGVTIGLALQGSLSNLAGGIMILLFRPFKIGDFIEGDGASGTVEEVSLFYVTLRSATNQRITIPNGELSNTKVTNYSIYPTRRLDIDFTVAYGTDNNEVIETIMSVVDSEELALKDPEPFLRMTSHGDSALVYTLRVWCERDNYGILKSNLMEKTNEAFNEKGIEIPYNTFDINVKNK